MRALSPSAEDLKSLDETKKTTELPNYAKDVLQVSLYLKILTDNAVKTGNYNLYNVGFVVFEHNWLSTSFLMHF